MRYNKTLGVAIAAILSGGIGLASADELYNLDFAAGVAAYGGGGDFDPSATSVASESIADDGTAAAGSVILNQIDTVFAFQNDDNIVKDPIYIDYTLIGAEFNTDINTTAVVAFNNPTTANTTDAIVTYLKTISNNKIRILADSDATDTISMGTTAATTGHVFDVTTDLDALEFTFTPINLTGLINNGGTVQLKAEWGYAATDAAFEIIGSSTQTLYQSQTKVEVNFNDKGSASKIDVTEGSKKFIDGYSATAITLGTVTINDDNTDYPIISTDSINEVTGLLVVTGGPFSASTGANQVFLDIDTTGGDCVFTPDTDDLAGVVVDDEVTFDLKVEHVDGIVAATAGVDVCVIVDAANETEINNTDDRASGVMVLQYPSDKTKTYVGRLAQVKRNGTTCTLYNVPHKQASDTGYYRFINKTDKDVTVWGTLKDRDAIEYFVDQELGTAAANSTLVVRSDALHDFATAAGAAEEKPWLGRAILTINSNSTDMEAYALLKGKNTKSVLLPAGATIPPAAIGPLVNVSLGASGNGCN